MQSDDKGYYRLKMTKDHYNIWAAMDERIAIAAKAIEAIPGETVADTDIKMVRGAVIVGTLINAITNEPIPIPEGQTRYISHHGPAYPTSGAAVGSSKVNPDGTYRIRVAPGLNYVYFNGGDMAEYVTVEDGQELKLDLVNRVRVQDSDISIFINPDSPFYEDQQLQSELTRQAEKEDADEAAERGN